MRLDGGLKAKGDAGEARGGGEVRRLRGEEGGRSEEEEA
jgi:hypothetical protein